MNNPDSGGIPGLMGVNGISPQQPSQQQQQQQQQILGNPAEGAQQFCLRWNSYPATVATQLAALRAAEDFVDVTLACDGRQLRAHKLVLSACSPYFMQLFKSTPCQHPVIFLRDVGFRQLVALLEFMYAGEVNVSQVELPALLRTAEALQVRGLADTTTNNNNNNNNNCAPPPPKPNCFQNSPSYGQNVGAPVMMTNAPTPLPVEPQNCSETPSVSTAQTDASSPKQPRRDERNANEDTENNVKTDTVEDDESDSNESHEEFEPIDQEMKIFTPDESGQIEEPDTADPFGEGEGDGDGEEADVDADPLNNINQTDIGTASMVGSQSEEETSEDEDDEDDGECKEFTYQSDASYSQETMPDGSNANGENTPGPSTGSTGLADGEGESGGNAGKDDSSGSGGTTGNAGSGRHRLSRSLWPPGIPYHGIFHGPQQCPYCPRTLSNVGNWRKHVLTMHFAREKVYKCRHCASSFRTAEYLQKHYVRVHNYPQKMTRRKYVEQT